MSIDVTNLSFSYGSREILHDLSFSIPDGCLVNVLGPNGVGKSTLFRCILGLSPHYSGTILVNGKDLRALSVRERAREISYIPQSHAPVYDYEVVDVVLMATGNDLKMLAHARGDPAAASPRGAGPHRHRALGPSHLHANLRRRAAARAHSPRHRAGRRTIIMDEPTSALDYGNTVRVLSCVRQLAREGMSIVPIDPSARPGVPVFRQDARHADGRVLAFGDPKDVITKELVSAIYGVDVEVNSLYGDKVRVCVPIREIER